MKKMLSFEELDGQMAMELPERELMAPQINLGGGLVNVQIGDIDVVLQDINVNVCPAVNAAVLAQDFEQVAFADCQ